MQINVDDEEAFVLPPAEEMEQDILQDCRVRVGGRHWEREGFLRLEATFP